MDNQPSQTTKKDGENPSTTTDPAEVTEDYGKTIYQYKNGELTGTYTVGELIKAPYGKSDMIVLYDPVDPADPAKIRKYKLDVFPLKINEKYTGNGYSFTKKPEKPEKPENPENPENPEKTGGKRRQTKKSRRTRKTKRRLRKISKK